MYMRWIAIILMVVSAMVLAILIIGHKTEYFLKTFSEEEWEVLRSVEFQHFTKTRHKNNILQEDGSIYLKKTKGSFKNLFAPKDKECVYFFKGRPSVFEQILQNNQKGDLVVMVKAYYMERNQVLYRRFDNAILYLDDYRGPGYFKKVK